MAPLIDVFDPRGRLVGAFPRGPLQLPPIGHHWYATRTTGTPTPRPSSPPSSACGPGSSGLADRTGVPIGRTVLGGFSQGAVMAWALGLGPGRPRPAGILAMSGALPAVPGFVLQLEDLGGLPVAITHGQPGPARRRRARPGRARPRHRRRGRRRLPRDRGAPHHRPAGRAGPRRPGSTPASSTSGASGARGSGPRAGPRAAAARCSPVSREARGARDRRVTARCPRGSRARAS